MNDALALTVELTLSGAAGALLGLLFFGGLWWTLRRAIASPRPALWVGGSLLLRMAGAAAGFVIVSAGDWRRLLACLLGFWAARWWVVRLTTRLAAEPSAASRLSLELANSRSKVDSIDSIDPIDSINTTLAECRVQASNGAGAVKCGDRDLQ